MIRSTMQDGPLTIGGIMRHGTRVYGRSECVTWPGTGTRRASSATVAQNAGRLAGAGVREATLARSGSRCTGAGVGAGLPGAAGLVPVFESFQSAMGSPCGD